MWQLRPTPPLAVGWRDDSGGSREVLCVPVTVHPLTTQHILS